MSCKDSNTRTSTYRVGGTVTGLTGTLVLKNNGNNTLTVSANGSFTFNGTLTNGSTYSVTVSNLPAAQACTITNGSGVIRATNVTNVQVSCVSPPIVHVVFPSAVSITSGDTIKVHGTILNNHSITSVSVNGVPAQTSDSYQSFQAVVPLTMGTNSLIVATNISPKAAEVIVTRIFTWPESLAIDSVNNRALVVDKFAKTVVSINLSTGTRTTLSDNKTPNATNPFSLPVGIAIDSAHNRALITDDNNHSAVVAMNLQTGARAILSDNSNPNSTNPFSDPGAIAIDSANNRALVADIGLDAVIAVDLETGTRTILSSKAVPNAVKPFSNPIGIAIDSANNRALVIDQALNAVIAVNLQTGARTILSDSVTPNAANPFSLMTGITIDNANNRALVTDDGNGAVVAVNLSTGARTIISNDSIPNNAQLFYDPKSIAIDSTNNRALITDTGRNVILAMNLSTGARTTLVEDSTPDNINPFISPMGVAMDSANHRALVVEGTLQEIIAVDLDTGARTILSSNTTPNGLNPFLNIEAGIAIDSKNNRALVGDIDRQAVIAVDLSTGARTIFLSNVYTNFLKPFFPTGIAIDSANNRALVVDRWNNALIAANLDSGNHTVLSDNTTPNTNNLFLRISDGIAIDIAKNRSLVVDTERNAVIAVDLSTGTRTTLSDGTTPDNSNTFVGLFGGIAIDSANHRALVTDTSRRAIIAVDLDTGARTTLSNYSAINAINPIEVPCSIAIDTIHDRILVTDGFVAGALFVIDPETGERVIFSK